MVSGKTNLFVYGSLVEPRIFKSVCGLSFTLDKEELSDDTLYAAPAFLSGYKKVTPDNVYFYAVESSSSRMEGYVIYDVPNSAMDEVDKYEGKRYKREKVKVNTASGYVPAEAYLVSKESMRKHFGDRFHVNLIHELWLRKRIEQFFKKHTRPGEKTTDAELERRAKRELLATTERDLVMTHYRSDAFSDFYIEHELDKPIPGIKHLFDNEKESEKFIPQYISLAVRQVILNQLDEKIQSRYRYELEHMDISERYFKRSISLLASLYILNSNKKTLDIIVSRCLDLMPAGSCELIDYVKYAINAADSIFDERVARFYLDKVKSSFQSGLIPLGAEIELSNLGYKAITPKGQEPEASDIMYDSFRYFKDFGLDILMWKLGGYIDDHTDGVTKKRKTGFLELAPGRLNIEGELSRPATNDPWVLNQLIKQIVTFYNVEPHSLHLSFQLKKNQIGKQKMLPLNFIKCLLILGGGVQFTNKGNLIISRMQHDEITQHELGEELVFSRTSKRNWHLGEDHLAERKPKQSVTHVQQYKFIRLEERASYEPLIMCLKGLQLECNPGEYLNIEQLKNNPKLRNQYNELRTWSEDPAVIDPGTIKRFTKAIYNGLMKEAHHKPAHTLHYIDWAISSIDAQLRMFNKKIKNLRQNNK